MSVPGAILKSVVRSLPKKLPIISRAVNNAKQVRTLKKAREELTARRPDFLGIEEDAESTFNDVLGNKTREIYRLERQTVTSKARNKRDERRRKVIEALSAKYHRLGMQLLKLRSDEGWPRLAFFALTSPNCVFRSQRVYQDEYTSVFEPELPAFLRKYYSDVQRKLSGLLRTNWGLNAASISCRFSGMIPADVKEKIVAAKKDFKTIFILAEIPEWSLKTEPARLPIGDPLVVGIAAEEVFLIADFDTTSLEDQVFLSDPDAGEPKPRKRSKKA